MVRLVNMSVEMREVIWDRFAAGELPYTISKNSGRFPFESNGLPTPTSEEDRCGTFGRLLDMCQRPEGGDGPRDCDR